VEILNNVSKNRIKWIDALKGFAILTVVIGHVADGYLNSNIFESHNNLLYIIFNVIYSFHMPLFFIISGYIFITAYCKEGKYDINRIKKQVKNLLIIYLFFSILQWCTKMLLSSFVNSEYSLKDLALILFKPMAPYWYLYNLIFYYILELIIEKKKISLKVIIVIALCLNVLSNFIKIYTINMLLKFFIYFYLGILLNKVKFEEKIKHWPIIISLIIGVGLSIIFWSKEVTFNNIMIINTLIAISISAVLVYIFLKIKRLYDSNILNICGRYCLEIYVLHCFFTAGNRVILFKLGLNNFYLNFIVNCVISTIFPILISIFVKKIGIYELFFKPMNFVNNLKNRKVEAK